MSVDHGSPIEQVLFLPGDAFIVTAGGQLIKIWNIASGGILHHTLHHHHKTVRMHYVWLALDFPF